MFRLIWSGVVILLVISGCGTGTPTRHNDFVPLTSIGIAANSPSIAFGTSTRLTANGNYSGMFTRDITSQVVWTSDTPTVAEFITASDPGRVTSHTAGVATLTATKGNVSATFRLTVTSATVTSLTITPAAPSVAKGLSTQFTTSGAFSDSTTQDLTFDAAWTSSATNVATVGNDASDKGFARAVAAGTATITATFGGVSGTALMTVTEPVLQSITVSPANPTVLSLSTVNFKATGNYSDGSTADITSQATWNSSRADVATIANSGAGIGTANTLVMGTAVISAGLGSVSGTSNLKVTGGNLTGITLNLSNPTLVKGTVAQLSATGSFGNGISRDITAVVQWSVADTSIATVATPGGNQAFLNALAVTLVPTTVTATSGTRTANTTLTVTNPLLQSISISQASLDLTAGTSSRFTVSGVFSDGTHDLTASADWSSSAATTATAGNTGLAKGRISGVAAGTATISAAYGGQTANSAAVTVRSRTIQSLGISGTPNVISGNQVKFTATASYTDGTSKDVTEDAAWTINNQNIAVMADTQNQPGQVVAVDSGTATLTATFGGKSQTVTLTVP